MGSRIDPRFCPHLPRPKQLLCLSLDDYEVLFGGAAGGGKSDFLLMAFLQYVDMPHYRGLILRRKSVDLERSEAILERAKSWWLPTSKTGVCYFSATKTFRFPSGATCQFGHANNAGDEEENYQGGAWQFIAFDELTQFLPRQYLYLFSRLRRTEDAPLGLPEIPLRMRVASNPGGVSHNFVRDRFMTPEYARAFLLGIADPTFRKQVEFVWKDRVAGGRELTQSFSAMRSFVPSKVRDGAVDVATYVMGLAQQDVIDRERLLSGDWLVSAQGRFKPEWFRTRYKLPEYNTNAGGYYQVFRPDGTILEQLRPEQCTRFSTVDPAGTESELTAETKGSREPSYSVMSTWDYYPKRNWLFLVSVLRLQAEFPEVLAAIRGEFQRFRPSQLFIERDGIGKPYYQTLTRENYPVGVLATEGKDKLTRAAPATNEAKEGRIIIPDYAPWLDAWEAEIFSWTGVKGEVWDQGDTMSYAVEVKLNGFAGAIIIQSMGA